MNIPDSGHELPGPALQEEVGTLSSQVAALQGQLARNWTALQGQISSLTQGLSKISAELRTLQPDFQNLQHDFQNHAHKYEDASTAMGMDSAPNISCINNGPFEGNCSTQGILTIMTYAGHNATQATTSLPVQIQSTSKAAPASTSGPH